jgi:folate-binding protein YgfZ
MAVADGHTGGVLDVEQTEQGFAASAVAVRARRDVVEMVGPDAGSYLHGQLSQDVLGLPVGSSAPTLLLQPQGKVDAWLRLTRLGNDRFWLDVDCGYGEPVLARLKRFMLRTDAELGLATLEMVAVRGPAAGAGPEALGFAVPPDGAIVDGLWPGVDGFDVLAPQVELPAGLAEGPQAALEALRIRLGIPAMGSELTTGTIPAAAGVVERSVDFAKGCYVGQELVARIDSRGSNTPTRLRGLRLERAVPAGHEADVVQGGQKVGSLTSVAPASAIGPVGLGYVKRSVDVPSAAELVGADGQPVPVQIVELPFT